MKHRLLHALTQLKPSYAEILRKHDLEGRTLEEIAVELSLSHECIVARHAREFRRLKGLWTHCQSDIRLPQYEHF
jgi:DNA-directed RNA polymerase specialized sigma24 family protein